MAGPDFVAKWGPRAVTDLFTYIVQTMPPTSPGVLGEQGTLEAVTEARARAISAQGPADQASAENVLTGALKSLFAVAESYPPQCGGRGGFPVLVGSSPAFTHGLRHGALEALNAVDRGSVEGASSYLRFRQLLLPTGLGTAFKVLRLERS